VLLLFDIDGTLIRERPLAHQKAMLAAVERVYGVSFGSGEDPIGEVVPNGKTDRQIVREILERRGIKDGAVDDGFPEFERTSCELHHTGERALLTGDARERTVAALAALEQAGHVLALLTGNLEPIARRKMELAGLGDFFARHQGGFGSDAEARADLVAIARRRAGDDGRPHPAGDTVVIGDTPLDVAAAHAGGARAIGVTGRRFDRDALLASGADAVVDELDEVQGVLAAWTSAT
jgi:phosphoglycolate phosphatase-like HAD superfamily hydrolase